MFVRRDDDEDSEKVTKRAEREGRKAHLSFHCFCFVALAHKKPIVKTTGTSTHV